MLTVTEDLFQQLADEGGKEVPTHLFGQAINAIVRPDLLLKGNGKPPKTSWAARGTRSSRTTPFRCASLTLCSPPSPERRFGRPT